MAKIVMLPISQGTRVRVLDDRLPEDCREGIIWQYKPVNGGYLVQHDSSPFGPQSAFFGHTMFGWTHDEVERIRH